MGKFSRFAMGLTAFLGISGMAMAQGDFSSGDAAGGAAGLAGCFFAFAAAFAVALIPAILMIIGMWKIFVKAGKPGWAALVPIYNMIVMLEIIGKPIWWIVLFFIPFVSFIAAIMVIYELGQRFDRSMGFTVGLILLPYVFFPILGFGSAQYTPPVNVG